MEVAKAEVKMGGEVTQGICLLIKKMLNIFTTKEKATLKVKASNGNEILLKKEKNKRTTKTSMKKQLHNFRI